MNCVNNVVNKNKLIKLRKKKEWTKLFRRKNRIAVVVIIFQIRNKLIKRRYNKNKNLWKISYHGNDSFELFFFIILHIILDIYIFYFYTFIKTYFPMICH